MWAHNLIAQLLLKDSLRYRMRVLSSYWFHFGDRTSFPLPRPLTFLYSVLRIPLAIRRHGKSWLRLRRSRDA
jgi:hypothetical protein